MDLSAFIMQINPFSSRSERKTILLQPPEETMTAVGVGVGAVVVSDFGLEQKLVQNLFPFRLRGWFILIQQQIQTYLGCLMTNKQ